MKRWLYILLLTFAASSLHAQFLFRISENGLEWWVIYPSHTLTACLGIRR